MLGTPDQPLPSVPSDAMDTRVVAPMASAAIGPAVARVMVTASVSIKNKIVSMNKVIGWDFVFVIAASPPNGMSCVDSLTTSPADLPNVVYLPAVSDLGFRPPGGVANARLPDVLPPRLLFKAC